jgi:hypothetical protein
MVKKLTVKQNKKPVLSTRCLRAEREHRESALRLLMDVRRAPTSV